MMHHLLNRSAEKQLTNMIRACAVDLLRVTGEKYQLDFSAEILELGSQIVRSGNRNRVTEVGSNRGESSSSNAHSSSSSGSTAMVKKSNSFALPYLGVQVEENCCALNCLSNIYVQCENPKEENGFCVRCNLEMVRKGLTTPEFGTIQDRLKVPPMEYVDPKGRKVRCYRGYMNRKKLTKEMVLAEAEKRGIILEDYHFLSAREEGGGGGEGKKRKRVSSGKKKDQKKGMVVEEEEEEMEDAEKMDGEEEEERGEEEEVEEEDHAAKRMREEVDETERMQQELLMRMNRDLRERGGGEGSQSGVDDSQLEEIFDEEADQADLAHLMAVRRASNEREKEEKEAQAEEDEEEEEQQSLSEKEAEKPKKKKEKSPAALAKAHQKALEREAKLLEKAKQKAAKEEERRRKKAAKTILVGQPKQHEIARKKKPEEEDYSSADSEDDDMGTQPQIDWHHPDTIAKKIAPVPAAQVSVVDVNPSEAETVINVRRHIFEGKTYLLNSSTKELYDYELAKLVEPVLKVVGRVDPETKITTIFKPVSALQLDEDESEDLPTWDAAMNSVVSSR